MSKHPSDVATCLAVFVAAELLGDFDAVAVGDGESDAVDVCEADALAEVPELDAVWLHPATPTARKAMDAIATLLMPLNASTRIWD